MRKSMGIILEKYQLRKSKKQKNEFIGWLREYLSSYDYDLTEDKYSKSGTNIIVGDVDSAEVILTAHYDTQPNFFMPVLMGFSNWFFFFISQLLILVPMALIFEIGRIIFKAIFGNGIMYAILMPIPLWLYLIQIFVGIANRHTANDNTSGVTTLISILEDMPPEERHKVCVVFFDQEELGMIGSGSFKNKYKKASKSKPLINFDCVSDGETLTFVMKKKFKVSENAALLKKASDKAILGSSKKSRFADAFWNIYTSDQIIFPNSVGVVAAKKAPVLGYYIDRLHSRWDTKFDNENIELLSRTMIEFVRTIESI